MKIESFIESNKENAFPKAFSGKVNKVRTNDHEAISYEDYELAYNSEPGYVLLAIGIPIGDQKIHEEAQMVDYLLFIDLFPSNGGKEIYIVWLTKLVFFSFHECSDYISRMIYLL